MKYSCGSAVRKRFAWLWPSATQCEISPGRGFAGGTLRFQKKHCEPSFSMKYMESNCGRGSGRNAKAMNDFSDFLKRLVEKLSEAGIPFMLVGSVAASYHGHPRSTFDIDAVVD